MTLFYGAILPLTSPKTLSFQLASEPSSYVFSKSSAFSRLSLHLDGKGDTGAGRLQAPPVSPVAPKIEKKGSLGTITETPSANPAEVRKRRYQLLYHAKKLLPKERIAGCLFKRVDAQQGVKVLFNKSRNKANYGNLQRCANPWACPYCSAKITESRKVDVRKAMDGHLATGGYVYLMTLTNSHNASHSLKFLKEGQREAMRRFMGGTRESRSLFAALGKQHHINAYEVTHGQNGFHPHHHVLLFVASKLEDDALQVLRDQLAAEWIHCCSKAGLPLPDMKYGLDIRSGRYAAEYVNKWGLEHEITKGHLKKGKQGSMTPFDLLRDYADNGNAQSGKLFQEFALSFKGARQLVWSRGLKKLYKIGEKTDQEIADETDKLSEELFTLDQEFWIPLNRQQRTADLLQYVEEDPSLQKAMDLIRQCLLNEHKIPILDG